MTCIVGLVQNGEVYIGGDSAGVGDAWNLTVRADEKVFRNGPFIMGFTSSFRMGQLLHYAFVPPKQDDGDDDRFMVTTFADAVRTCLKAGGIARKDNEIESCGMFLVGYKGRLYSIGSDYQIEKDADEFSAIGCGFAIAQGALHATRNDRNPRRRILTALQAAERFNAGVRGPFVVLKGRQ